MHYNYRKVQDAGVFTKRGADPRMTDCLCMYTQKYYAHNKMNCFLLLIACLHSIKGIVLKVELLSEIFLFDVLWMVLKIKQLEVICVRMNVHLAGMGTITFAIIITSTSASDLQLQ